MPGAKTVNDFLGSDENNTWLFIYKIIYVPNLI